MKNNSLEINPQMWEYGGLRMNEVNFLKFCFYIKLLLEKNDMSNTTYCFDTLASIFIKGRPTVSFDQLWHYVSNKWTGIISSGVSTRTGWFNWWVFRYEEYYFDTYLKLYTEIEEQIRTKDLTIDMVMDYYNPEQPSDVLSFYSTLYPEAYDKYIKRFENQFAAIIYQQIKLNTPMIAYKLYPYDSYISNELALTNRPKPQLLLDSSLASPTAESENQAKFDQRLL